MSRSTSFTLCLFPKPPLPAAPSRAQEKRKSQEHVLKRLFREIGICISNKPGNKSTMFARFIVCFLSVQLSAATLITANACLGGPPNGNLPIPGTGGCGSGPDYCSTFQAFTDRPSVCQVFVTGAKDGDVRIVCRLIIIVFYLFTPPMTFFPSLVLWVSFRFRYRQLI